jgi:hypothetical protein
MTTRASKFEIYWVRGLPPGLFGEAYGIVTGSEIVVDEYRSEHFLLTQRPNEAMQMWAFDIFGKSFPAEFGPVNADFAMSEAYRQLENDLQSLLALRATEVGRPDLAYARFELEKRPSPFVGCWMRGLFTAQLVAVKQATKCLSLVTYLGLLQQIKVARAVV